MFQLKSNDYFTPGHIKKALKIDKFNMAEFEEKKLYTGANTVYAGLGLGPVQDI